MAGQNQGMKKTLLLALALAVIPVGVDAQGTPSDSCSDMTILSPLEDLRTCAEQGNTSAQNNLGNMYSNGRGVPQDYAEAVRWSRLAAEQGNARGQYNLGVMYANGDGVPQDDVEAVRLYRLAAEQGNAGGQSNLGLMYANGLGVPEDDAEAVRWYRLAADQGNAVAQYNLERLSDGGEGALYYLAVLAGLLFVAWRALKGRA